MSSSRSGHRRKASVVTTSVLKIDSHRRLNQYVREGNIASTVQTQVFTAKDQHTQSVVVNTAWHLLPTALTLVPGNQVYETLESD